MYFHENHEHAYNRNKNRVVVLARQATKPGGIGSLESILGLLKSLKIRAQIPFLVAQESNPSLVAKSIPGPLKRVKIRALKSSPGIGISEEPSPHSSILVFLVWSLEPLPVNILPRP